MPNNLEGMSAKELREVVKIQAEEYQSALRAFEDSERIWEDRLYKLEAENAELKQAIMSNCYDDPSTSGKRLMALVNKPSGGE